MSKLVITIHLDNAAFHEVDGDAGEEVAFVLKRLSNDIIFKGLGIHPIRDHNGNTVGRAELIEDNNPAGICATQRNAK